MHDAEHTYQTYEDVYASYHPEVPEFFNFGFDVVDMWAEKDRNRLAMIWADQEGHERNYTFRHLMNLSNQAANMLLKYGINKGDRVIIMLHRIPEWWIFAIAAIKLGAVFCPCPTMLTPKDLEYRVNAGKFKMVITDTENAWKVDEICAECPSLVSRFLVDGEMPGWISYPIELTYPAPASTVFVRLPGMRKTRAVDPMLIFFTSGTTGEPKMVLHNQAYPIGHIVTGKFWLDIKQNDLHFTLADTGWGKCAWGKFFGPWMQGACTLIFDIRGKFKATELLPVLEKYEVTSFCAPPTVYRMLILADLEKFDLSQLRHCVSAGEPLNPEVIRAWEKGTDQTIYEGYGQTETVLCVGTFPCMEPKLGSMGRPSPGWQVELHDDEGKPVPTGEEGRIAIRAEPRPPGMFMEYFANPTANEESFQDGWYYTGDKAYMDEDGYFWFVGRDDDVIKSSGYRVGPFEVESALMEHPAVQECAVVGSPDIIRGMIIKAFVVLAPGFEPSDVLIKELQKFVKRMTAPYKYPRAIEFVEDLPKTISGKIKRNVLRELELERHNSQGGEEKE
ncbi:acyl-CoA synthetase [Methanofollis aquaemaris]|uniref:Acyl-CoA synthetase n=1 Tax=Methanofollis aquaemaris TaxID=126734 RepID=A0A8A3S242_9EURY|nr:AMP-binding protein [Methanofollis aquaemaris]QSZ66222.1 acyl-CoA synthetase [Methanofollis aquaemaris]